MIPLYPGALATLPIQTLPVELLSYVLELATHATSRKNPDSEYSFDASSVKAPLVYSTVCRHWRTVALGTPSLWTSLCVTIGNLEDQEDADDSQNSKQVLDTTHLDTYLKLSRKCSIDILIDARDPYWDFCEPEIPSTCDRRRIDGDSDPSSTFSLTTIQTISSILLPHLSRWRSLEILTDTWLPMQSFLSRINAPLIELGAPKLEYLTLMRCNDFISHSPWFEPREGKGMAFLSRPRQREEYTYPSHPTHRYKLPRLRSLVLRGVHADWDELGEVIGTELETLDLSSHSNDVRPTLPQIRNMLKKSASLTKLVISGSGVVFSLFPGAPVMKSSDNCSSNANLGPIRGSASADHSRAYSPSLIAPLHLPHLHTLQLGYRSHFSTASDALRADATNFLSILNAPTLCNLKIEDASHPGDEEFIDAGELLGMIASGNEPSSPGTRNRAASWSEGVPVQPAPQRKFPALQKLTLKGVKASHESFRNFFWSVDGFSGSSPNGVGGLRELQLVGAQVLGHVGGMDILAALASTHSHFNSFDSFSFPSTSSSPPRRFSEPHAFPYLVQPVQNPLVQPKSQVSSPFSSQPLHPCPNLQTLLICPSGPVVPNDFEFLIHRIIHSRSGRLRAVDVRLTEDSLYAARQRYINDAGVKLTSAVSNILDALLVTADSLNKAAVQDDAPTGTGEPGDDDSSRAVGTWLVYETGRDIELLSTETSSNQCSRPVFTQRGTLLSVFKPNPILYSSYDAKLAEAEAEAEAYRHCGIPYPYDDDDDDGSIFEI